MAQYELILIQNIAASGNEFDEKRLLIPKGGIITSTASGVVSVLLPGINGQNLVSDSTEPLGLKWEDPSGGTLTGNIDGGTASSIYTFGQVIDCNI